MKSISEKYGDGILACVTHETHERGLIARGVYGELEFKNGSVAHGIYGECGIIIGVFAYEDIDEECHPVNGLYPIKREPFLEISTNDGTFIHEYVSNIEDVCDPNKPKYDVCLCPFSGLCFMDREVLK